MATTVEFLRGYGQTICRNGAVGRVTAGWFYPQLKRTTFVLRRSWCRMIAAMLLCKQCLHRLPSLTQHPLTLSRLRSAK